MAIDLVIADDHPIILAGLRTIFDLVEDIDIVGEATTGQQTLEIVRLQQPTVLMLDVRLPDITGISVIEQLDGEGLHPAIVVFTAYNNPTYIARALSYGVASYMLKGSSAQDLVSTVRDAANGVEVESNYETRRVAGMLTRHDRNPNDQSGLTEREKQVIRHLAVGLSNKDIARSLEISAETVKEHVQHILQKLNVSDRTKAAVWALKNGLAK